MTDQSKKSDWHPAWIKFKLDTVAKTSIRGLSLANNYSDGTLKTALRRPYPSAEAIIAKAIGVTPDEIWPSRYNEDGTPIKRAPGRKARINSTTKPLNCANLREAK